MVGAAAATIGACAAAATLVIGHPVSDADAPTILHAVRDASVVGSGRASAAFEGEPVPRDAVVVTGPAGSAVLVTRGRRVLVPAAAAIRVTDGTRAALLRGAALVDGRR